MQKISTYLYPNRIQLLADLAGFNVEFTNVYQRPVKIYKGVDNVLEFDVKNADEKRLELLTSPEITNLQLNIMDASGYALPNSPYTLTPSATIKGIASVTIPSADLADLSHQYLSYGVTATKGTNTIPLYGDTRFGLAGTIELIANAMPVVREPKVYKDFTAEIDLNGNPIYHSSAMPVKFYEAIKTTSVDLAIDVVGFKGTIWVEAATSDTISVESWRNAGKPFGSWIWDGSLFTGTIPFGSALPIGDYTHFRVSYQTPTLNGRSAIFRVTKENNTYSVTLEKGGTGYGVGAVLRVPGSLLGGVDVTNDLYITVTSLEGGISSYAVSSIVSFTWEGTASNGTGTYSVSGINYAGVVDKITLS